MYTSFDFVEQKVGWVPRSVDSDVAQVRHPHAWVGFQTERQNRNAYEEDGDHRHTLQDLVIFVFFYLFAFLYMVVVYVLCLMPPAEHNRMRADTITESRRLLLCFAHVTSVLWSLNQGEAISIHPVLGQKRESLKRLLCVFGRLWRDAETASGKENGGHTGPARWQYLFSLLSFFLSSSLFLLCVFCYACVVVYILAFIALSISSTRLDLFPLANNTHQGEYKY